MPDSGEYLMKTCGKLRAVVSGGEIPIRVSTLPKYDAANMHSGTDCCRDPGIHWK
jgi:hypothetical protein